MNKKWHNCISYAWGHRVKSGVCAWYWLFTILGECVVSSKIGTTSKIETHECKTIIIINHVCLGKARWGRSTPRAKDQNFIFGQTYVSNDESSQKCRKACEACCETPEIRDPQKYTGFDEIK